MSGGFVIRRPWALDIPEMLRLLRDLAAYEQLSDKCVAREAELGEAFFSAEPMIFALLADVLDRPVGIATWFYTFSTFAGRPIAYVEDLFVEPAYRRRGIARALLRKIAREARGQGCMALEWKVLRWNEPALGFYRKLGARPVDDWMTQRLSEPELAALAG